MGKNYSRVAYMSLALAIGLAVGLQLWSDSAQPALGNQLVSGEPVSEGLISHVLESDGKPTRVIIIDPQLRSMGVYDINREDGKIELKSVRRLTADLQMLEFKIDGVPVEDIQKALQRQK